MSYFTTMNLPAPSYDRFLEKFEHYRKKPTNAVSEFERELVKFFEVDAVSTFTNCFTALSLALLYATRKRPDTVAIAGLSYRRTTDIVLWAGLRPIYVDNDPISLAMSLFHLEEKLATNDVGCVLLQHPMVNICDPFDYISICDNYGVPVVFDSVEATGASYKNRKIGGFGELEGFSLHPSKVINGAEGGVLTFGRIADYHKFLEYLHSIGVIDDNEKKQIFGLEPVHAIMGLASLEVYGDVRSQFNAHYLTYREKLMGSESYRLVQYDMTTNPNFKSVLVELRDTFPASRDALLQHLESHGIGARPYYAPLHRLAESEPLPVARRLSKLYFFLPIGHSVATTDIEFICRELLRFERQMLGG